MPGGLAARLAGAGAMNTGPMKKTPMKIVLAAGALALLAGCVSMPSGPSVMVLPGTGKTFDQFRVDDLDCRAYANYQVGGENANDAAVNSGVKSAAIGTAIGAVAGAAIGGRSGAAAGAGVGLLGGSAVGASSGTASGYELQRRYDHGYQQCMYSKGHRVPTAGRFDNGNGYSRPTRSAAVPPPPPPAGTPPPPPPGVVN
jgi:hypothetical protein